MKLSDLQNKNKDYIEVHQSYPFAIRNILDETSGIKVNRHTGQQVSLHTDIELSILEKSGIVHTSNVGGNMTDWHLHTECDSVAWVGEYACRLAEHISRHLAIMKFECHESWGVHYEKEMGTKRHTHWPYQFSFGYYVKVPDYAPIVFPTANFEHNPRPGDLIVFPGHVAHEVPPVTGDRIMIAGNLRNINWSDQNQRRPK